MVVDDSAERIVEDLAAVLPTAFAGGDHDGPCVNFDGQDPKQYDEYDSCSRHIAAAKARQGALRHLAERAGEWAAARDLPAGSS